MIEIKENNNKNGSGFDTIHTYDAWKVVFITYSEQYGEFEKANLVKRHTETDEVFVLLKGEARLYTQDADEPFLRTDLEKEKLYCVKKNTWHHLYVSSDALLVVVENSNTIIENTERKNLAESDKRVLSDRQAELIKEKK